MDPLLIRFLCAFTSGVLLSQTGSFIQLSTRNILASPSTLGFDGLSIFWILIFHSMLIFFHIEQPYIVMFLCGLPIFLFIGWGFGAFLGHYKNINKLVLIGLTFNLLVGGLFSFWQFLFLALNLPFPVELWFGHFRYSDVHSFVVLIALELFIVFGWALLRRHFQVMSLGESLANNLNVNLKKLYLFLFLSVAAGTFAVVSLFGAFSFIGLIFPLIARRLWFKKSDLDGEILWGALQNGMLLMLLDALCFYFPLYGAEVPVGLIVTIVGAVSLIFLLWKTDSSLEILAKREK